MFSTALIFGSHWNAGRSDGNSAGLRPLRDFTMLSNSKNFFSSETEEPWKVWLEKPMNSYKSCRASFEGLMILWQLQLDDSPWRQVGWKTGLATASLESAMNWIVDVDATTCSLSMSILLDLHPSHLRISHQLVRRWAHSLLRRICNM